jgi:hypothetical protein
VAGATSPRRVREPLGVALGHALRTLGLHMPLHASPEGASEQAANGHQILSSFELNSGSPFTPVFDRSNLTTAISSVVKKTSGFLFIPN